MPMRTIDRFPYNYHSLDDLPPPVGEALRVHCRNQTIRSIVLIPPQEHATRLHRWALVWSETPQCTLAFTDAQITAVAVEGGSVPQVTTIPLQALTSIEVATILLYAHLKMTWIKAGHIEQRMIEFNAVGEAMIRSQLDLVRPQIACPMVPDTHPCLPFPDLSLKFSNYLRLALLSGEELRAVVFQPALYHKGRWRRRLIATCRTVAITDRHVLFIEENGRLPADYGVISRFVPLARIQRIIVEPGLEWDGVRLMLGTAEVMHEVEIPLCAQNATALCDALNQLIGVPILELPGPTVSVEQELELIRS